MIKLSVMEDSITFATRVQPRASRSEVAGELNGALKIRLAAPPVDGEGNEELILLSALDVEHIPFSIAEDCVLSVCWRSLPE